MNEFIKKYKYIFGIAALLLTVSIGTVYTLWRTMSTSVDISNSSSEEIETNGDIVDLYDEESSSSQEIDSTSQSSSIPPSSSSKPPISNIPSSIPPVTKPIPVPVANGKNIVGYYTGYSSYSGFTPNKVDATKLTHINYAFAKIDDNSKIALADSENDLKNFKQLRALKNDNKNLKLLISVGGWEYSTNFSNAALTDKSRDIFAQSGVDFIIKHGFDGMDLDWEFPVSGGLAQNSNRPEDKQNFTLMLKAIREKLNEQSSKDGKQYYLTIAAAPNSTYLKKIELSKIAQIVDYIFLMGYDMHGPWDSYSDFNAPLYTPDENSPQYKSSLNDGISLYLNTVSGSKIVLGMPFYGYKYEIKSNDNNGLYQKISSAKSVGYDNILKNYLYNDKYEEFYHEKAKVPYLYGEDSFITFENPQSIINKVSFAKSKGLGGVGIWELSHDRNAVLLNNAYNTLY